MTDPKQESENTTQQKKPGKLRSKYHYMKTSKQSILPDSYS